ncbi:MAG: ubiquitin-like small modifier protein 1 [Thermoplasmatota archaeon]
MTVKVKLFATLRESVGTNEIELSATDVKDLLNKLESKYKALKGKFFKDQDRKKLKDNIIIIKKGRNIIYLEGLETELEDNDEISIFPSVGGG